VNKHAGHRTLLLIRIIVAAVIAAITLSGCGANEEQSQKQLSLSEYLSETNENWFLTGKKQYTVQAMMVSKETTFHNDLEVVDLVAADDGETVVLKGSRDEIWTSPLSQVLERYTLPDGNRLCKEDFASKDAFIDIVTIPTRDTYYAMHVPKDITVVVETAQGDVLHTNLPNSTHGEGDYLICTIGEDGNPNLSDVWVLNGSIFPECYDTSHLDEQ
jgi:hypothetical protein